MPGLSIDERRDIVDSLKLEHSSLPPKVDAKLRETVKNVGLFLANRYERFMSKETLKKAYHAGEAVLFHESSNSMEEYLQYWFNQDLTPDEKEEIRFIGGFCDKKYDIIHLQDPTEMINIIVTDPQEMFKHLTEDGISALKKIWSQFLGKEITTKEQLGEILKRFSPQDISQKINLIFNLSLVHETCHYLEGNLHERPIVFRELGAIYYTYQSLKDSPLRAEIEQAYAPLIAFYESLLSQYGDDVHRLFFGGKLKTCKPEDIYLKAISQGEKLFPDLTYQKQFEEE